MRIRQLSIRNFRGIKELDWTIGARSVCLIGPNNATKTTILEAISLVLSPRWNATFSDSDFHKIDVTESIEITATICDLPDSLKPEQKYGGYLRGWNSGKGVIDEPGYEDKECLTVRLKVDKTLEPEWHVINDRAEIRIGARERAKFGVSRVGSFVDRDLTWGKGAALARVTESTNSIDFAGISRGAYDAVSRTDLRELESAAAEVEDMSKRYGVKPDFSFHARLNIDSVSIAAGALALHDENVPVRQYGLGSKRLVTLAMQKEVTDQGTILLIDEIEHGLDPYRLRSLVRLLRDDLCPQTENRSKLGQVFSTSHSPIAVVESDATELHVVRNNDGRTQVLQIPGELQAFVRSHPEALLAPRIVVCEGKTELGLLIGIDVKWTDDSGGAGMTYHGVFPIFGGGSTARGYAEKLKTLGYMVLLFVDGDVEIDSATLQEKGIETLVWADNFSTEKRVFFDLPSEAIIDMVKYAMEHNSCFRAMFLDQFSDIEELSARLDDNSTALDTRTFLANAADRSKAFKRIDHGERLGRRISQSLDSIPETDLFKKLASIRKWIVS